MSRSSTGPKRVIVYVDGFNLYYGLKEAFGRRFLWLDLEQLAQSLLRSDQTLSAVHYFTAEMRDDPKGGARQHTYLEALQTRQRVHIHEGQFQSKNFTCRACGTSWQSYEEKETDVAIASRLIVDAATEAMDVAMLVSADSDLVPAVKAARVVHSTIRVVAAFPPQRHSQDLRNHVDAWFKIGRGRIRNAQLPDRIALPNRTLERPKRWQ
jgi:uncharacterized LabA/DUF88 family protein